MKFMMKTACYVSHAHDVLLTIPAFVAVLTICSCSTISHCWFVSHKQMSVTSTKKELQSTVFITERRKPFTPVNSFKKSVYVCQSFPADTLFNVSKEQFSVLYRGESKKFKVYKVTPSAKSCLKRPDSLFSPSLLYFTFQVNAKTNDSIFVIERDVPRKGDTTVVSIGIAEPVTGMDEVDMDNYVEVGSAFFHSGEHTRYALRRPSLYEHIPSDKDECVQDFAVRVLSYDEMTNSVVFSYEGNRYCMSLSDNIVDKHKIGQGKSVGIRVRFYDCLKYRHDEGALPPAKIIGLE